MRPITRLICFCEQSNLFGCRPAEEALARPTGLLEWEAADGRASLFLDTAFVVARTTPPAARPTTFVDDLLHFFVAVHIMNVGIAEGRGLLEHIALNLGQQILDALVDAVLRHKLLALFARNIAPR